VLSTREAARSTPWTVTPWQMAILAAGAVAVTLVSGQKLGNAMRWAETSAAREAVRDVEPRFGAIPGVPAAAPAEPAASATSLAGLTLVFEENRGQTDPSVRFIARGPRYTQFVTAREVVWRLGGSEGQDYAVHMSFPGASAADAVGEAALAGRSNYLKGSDPAKWVAGARQFSAVRLAGLYPGVSLKLYGTRTRPEYDFILEPGAEVASIRLKFSGAATIALGERGELIVGTPAGELIHHAPIAYQQDAAGRRTQVDARFVQTAQHELRFEVGDYDRTRELVIDPVYEYSTYLGGTGPEALQGAFPPDPWQSITVNGAGEVYAAGVTASSDFPVTAGVVQPALRADLDFYIVKLSAAGDTLLYSTYLGGTGDELGAGGIAVNGSGEILFGGSTQSSDFPTTPGAYRTTAHGPNDTDIVALKINAAGDALVYSTYLGSNTGERLFGFAADAAGSIYLAGATVSGASVPFPVTAGAYNTTGDQFITKLLPDGSGLAYSTRFGTSLGGEIRIRAMVLDSSNNVYITGLVSTNSLPLRNAYDSTLGGSFDGFVTKINAAGNDIVYSTYLGGNGTDEPLAIAVDATGNAYIAGSTVGTPPPNSFPTTPGTLRTAPSNQWNGFLVKLNDAGNALVWSTYLTPPNRSSNNAIALDGSNRVYVANDGNNPPELRVGEALESCFASTGSPGLIRVSADGTTVEYGTRVGGTRVLSGGMDVSFHPLNDIAVDGANNVYLIGSSNSPDFPTLNGFQGARAGLGDDAYIAKLSDAASLPRSTLEFSAATFSGAETAGRATITVSRTGRAGGPLSVRVTTGGGTATPTADYTPVDTILEWRNGDMMPKTFDITLVSDGAVEPAETVNLNLTLSQNGCIGDIGAQATAVLTINDAAAPSLNPGTLQLSAATYAAGEGAGNAPITVTRTGGADGAVSVRLTTSNGTATAGADYTAADVVVTFADGDAAPKTVNIPILQDTSDEPDETVNLALSAPTGGATLGAQTSAVLTITDDDPATSTPPPPPPPSSGGGGRRGGSGSLDLLLLFGLVVVLGVRQPQRKQGRPPRAVLYLDPPDIDAPSPEVSSGRYGVTAVQGVVIDRRVRGLAKRLCRC
jgi:Calx-beta domain/Beta-propeller repeat